MITSIQNDNPMKGIFWIKDQEHLDTNEPMLLRVRSDIYGNTINSEDTYNFTSKDGGSYTHQSSWNLIPKQVREGHKYNYYPRGRVEIRNGEARIFVSIHICTQEVKEWIIKQFYLTKQNGIKRVKMIAENDEHYHCYLDDTNIK